MDLPLVGVDSVDGTTIRGVAEAEEDHEAAGARGVAATSEAGAAHVVVPTTVPTSIPMLRQMPSIRIGKNPFI